MFFRQRRVMRRARQHGASLRALHEILGEQPLSPQRLLDTAEHAARDDFNNTLLQNRYQDPDFVLGFVMGYTQAEVQIRLPAISTMVKEVSVEEALRASQPGRYD